MVSTSPHPRAEPALNPPWLSPPAPPYLQPATHIPAAAGPPDQGTRCSASRAHMLFSPPDKGGLGTGASRRGLILRATALVAPRQCFSCRGKKHVMRRPAVCTTKMPLSSLISMRNPSSLRRGGISWLVTWLHHRRRANRTLYTPLTSPPAPLWSCENTLSQALGWEDKVCGAKGC